MTATPPSDGRTDALVAACRHARDFFASNARALRLGGGPRDRIKAEHYEAHQAVMEAALGEAGEGGAR